MSLLSPKIKVSNEVLPIVFQAQSVGRIIYAFEAFLYAKGSRYCRRLRLIRLIIEYIQIEYGFTPHQILK